MACFTAATFDAVTTGALATASSIFCRDRAEWVRVTVSPVFEAAAPAACASPCALSATTPLLFEPLMGAIGSAVEYALILSVTEILLGLMHLPIPSYRHGSHQLYRLRSSCILPTSYTQC